ncbi:SRPBCC family protein [Virgibacillus sp. NKC19-16]|uniref:SRPBCC family protein n=1 Tax=Virgibacillus salidurans TaxID=2831673 RepID=UPI001F1B8EEB|nr:SRPBCC family protein [Virgibacillus sp. NKC19-16]UJL47002.1 SRPBCC family protein [Virgibacillus sp. NKC19-16]
MIATIDKLGEVPTAVYERQINYPVDDVWSYLTENEKLQLWFPELEIGELEIGGKIHFDLQDGTYETMDILEVDHGRVFAFTWDKNSVRFELTANSFGCRLVFKEYLNEVTGHTAKDLAGWHICLDVIEALLDGTTIRNRRGRWNKWYSRYQELIKEAML